MIYPVQILKSKCFIDIQLFDIRVNALSNLVCLKMKLPSPRQIAQLFAASSHTQKGYMLDSQSGHILKFQV